MLVLSEKDIFEAASLNDIVDSVETAMILYEEKEFHMPDRVHVDYRGNTLLLMPCFAGKSLGTKLVTLFSENARKGLPVLYGIMILNDGQTGEPLAVLNGAALTALRTGAVGSVSIRHMTPENIQTLGIVGAGVQGFSQARVACSQRKFSAVYVFDIIPEKAASLTNRLQDVLPESQVYQAGTIEHLLKESDVVITATTSLEPVLPNRAEWLQGKHFVGIGSFKPDMREFPEALFRLLKKIYIDTDYAVEESGDLSVPLEKHWIERNQISSLGKFILKKQKRGLGTGETTLFKSVGMALFDVVVSELIANQALEKGLGQEIVL